MDERLASLGSHTVREEKRLFSLLLGVVFILSGVVLLVCSVVGK
ncbi:hypothetical protein ETAA8_15090 [Anatilimnocola aggregata]|uniref:Uncharacterized protein n=2 Tax=Anatilimnocola aggregata TaxID=2528021 RepID=A0A517Y8A5_9BACT|nr:hypothetical protein ETAA8_15090 [Anatilimnocola aggregata]